MRRPEQVGARGLLIELTVLQKKEAALLGSGTCMDGAILPPLQGRTDPPIDRDSLPPEKGEPVLNLAHPQALK